MKGTRDSLEIVLEQGRILAGVVLDHAGLPLVGASVQILGQERFQESVRCGDKLPTLSFGLGLDEVVTDVAGRFRFDDLYAGEFELKLRPLYGGTRAQTDTAGDRDVVVRIDRFALERVVVSGRVVDFETGQPVQEFTVWPQMVSAEDPAVDISTTRGFNVADVNGDFRIEGLHPARSGLG